MTPKNPLQDLIIELCPQGVEYKPLWKLTIWDKRFKKVPKEWQTKTTKFKHISAEGLKKLVEPNGNIKLLSTGKFDGYTTLRKAGNVINHGEVISIPSGGRANIKYYNGQFVDSGNILAISRDPETHNFKFIFYFLLHNTPLIESFFQGTNIKHPDMGQILSIQIPIPPLEIQNRIVEFLDDLTQLESELERELSARKKQYEHYRNTLLSFESLQQRTDKLTGGAKVRMCSLGEVCEILDNLRIPISKDKRMSGKYPYYGANGIQDYVNNYLFDGTYLLMGEDGSVINQDKSPVLNWAKGKFWVNNHAHILGEKTEIAKLRFLFFYLQTCDVSPTVRGTPPKINQENLRKIKIPIPPIEVQNEVVEILDRFDAMVSSITEGLPAEINARKKQYEYYRDRLLSFEAL